MVVSAGAKVLGGFTVGDGAKIGSNAVVIKPVPAGATAVGIPARIIPAKAGASADVADGRRRFSAYGVTRSDDPLSPGDARPDRQRRVAGAPDRAALAGDREAVREPGKKRLRARDARREECFEAEKLTQLVGK